MVTVVLMLQPGSLVDFETFRKHHPNYMVGIYVPSSRGGQPQAATSIRFEIGSNSPYPDEWIVEEESLSYTGQGKVSDGDQTWNRYNLGMRIACEDRTPVKVFEKQTGGQYYFFGEWYVTDYGFRVVRKSGQKVLRFTVSRNLDGSTKPSAMTPILSDHTSMDAYEPAARARAETYRILRDTALSKRVKEIQNYVCEICGQSLVINGSRYAEAHHIVPLGEPHNGPDIESNIIVLCPNHHAMFDYGELCVSAEDGLSVMNSRGEKVVSLASRRHRV